LLDTVLTERSTAVPIKYLYRGEWIEEHHERARVDEQRLLVKQHEDEGQAAAHLMMFVLVVGLVLLVAAAIH
jgi:hypothetical protein